MLTRTGWPSEWWPVSGSATTLASPRAGPAVKQYRGARAFRHAASTMRRSNEWHRVFSEVGYHLPPAHLCNAEHQSR